MADKDQPEPTWGAVQFPEKAMPLFKPAPYKVLHGGRGSGKTWSFGRALLLLGSRRKLFILCAREIQKSIKDSVHKVLSDQAEEMRLGWPLNNPREPFYRATNSNIIGANGTMFAFAGIRNNITSIKSMEAIDICAVFEATFVTKSSWDILLPTVRRDPPFGPFGQGSEVWTEFNPELATDETYQRWVVAPPRGAVVIEMNYRDNPWFPRILHDQMEQMREKDYDSYLTVWEGKTRKTLEGAIYARELAAAITDGRVNPHVKHDRSRTVDVSFDLGRSDMCAMWFWQQRGMDHYAFDYHGEVGRDFSYFLEEIQKRGYLIGRIFLPHDADHHHQSAAKSIAQQARAAYPGDGRVVVVPRIPAIATGINLVRQMFPRIHFNEITCADGIQALTHYQYGVHPDTKERTVYPLHNWASNPADALRTYVEGLRDPEKDVRQPDDGYRARPAKNSLGWLGA